MTDNFIFVNINMALQQHPIYYLEDNQYKVVGAAFLGNLGESIIQFAQELNTNYVVLSGDKHACHLVENIIRNLNNQLEISVKGENI